MHPLTVTISTTLAACLLPGCASPTPPVVQQFGGMREVMREGHTEPRIRLRDAVARPHALAIGALEGLHGEVTIVDGDVWVSRVADNQLQVTGPNLASGDQATLLSLTNVEKWQSVAIENPAEGAELESLIQRAAAESGIEATKPFPFMIEGESAGIDLHVINGYCPIAVDPSTVDAKPWYWSSERSPHAVIVGFHALKSPASRTL